MVNRIAARSSWTGTLVLVIALICVGLSAGAHGQTVGEAVGVASKPYRTSYNSLSDASLLGAEVRLDHCVQEDGRWQPLNPETDRIQGFAVFLHSGHPFSVRTLFWSEAQEAIVAFPAAWRPRFNFGAIADRSDRDFLLSQVVVKLLINDRLVPLVLDHDPDSDEKTIIALVYRPACSPSYPVQVLPDLYPTIRIRPLEEPWGQGTEEAEPMERALDVLRAETSEGRPLPFFLTGAHDLSKPLGTAVRPFDFYDGRSTFRRDIAYEDFLERVHQGGEAAFLETLVIPAELDLLGSDRPIQRQFFLDRRPMAWRQSGLGGPGRDQPQALLAQLWQAKTKIASLSRRLEAADAGQKAIDGNAQEEAEARIRDLTGQLTAAQTRIEELSAQIAEMKIDVAALEEAEARIRDLTDQLAAAQARKEELSAQIAEMKIEFPEYTRLKSELSFAQAKAIAAEVELQQEKEAVASLQSQVQFLKDRIAELERRPVPPVENVRIVLPALFSGRDMSRDIQLAEGGGCAGAAVRTVENDPLSYSVVDCTDEEPKQIVVRGFSPVVREGLTAELAVSDLVPTGNILDVDVAWRPYFPLDEAADKLTLPPISLAGIELVEGADPDSAVFAYPVGLMSAPQDSEMATTCRGTIPIALDDLLNGAVPINSAQVPPCAVVPIDLSSAWFSAEGIGIDGCLAGYSADVPLCARRWDDRFTPVTITAGAGWEPVSLVPTDGEGLTWETLAPRLRPVWPFADTNPADPNLPGWPVYTVSTVKYDRDAVSCINSRAGEQGSPENPLLPLGSIGSRCVGGGFSLDRLPETMTVTFKQPADRENLVYLPTVTKTFSIDTGLSDAGSAYLGAEDLIGSYPLVLAGKWPKAGPDAIVYVHPSLESCEMAPQDGKAYPYQANAPLSPGVGAQLGTVPNKPDRLVLPAAVVVDGGHPVTVCAELKPDRLDLREATSTVWPDPVMVFRSSVRLPTAGDDGSCVGIDWSTFVGPGSLQLSLGRPLLVREDDAVVFAEPTGGARYARSVHFNQWVEALRLSADKARVLVATRAGVEIGWVARADLHCGVTPLKITSCPPPLVYEGRYSGQEVCTVGVVRKAIIRSELTLAGFSKPVKANTGSRNTECGASDVCRELSGGEIVFIHGERNGRYLLARDYWLGEGREPLGWVGPGRMVRWNNNQGIRPRTVEVPDDEAAVCAYHSVSDGRAQQGCLPVAATKAWYRLPWRLPVLARYAFDAQTIIEVAVPGDRGGETVCSETAGGDEVGLASVLPCGAPGTLPGLPRHLFFPESENITTDLWVLERHLSDWQRILRPLKEPLPVGAEPETFVRRFGESFSETLGGVATENGRLLVTQLMDSGRLTLRPDSPLLHYSVTELGLSGRIQPCELSVLRRWADASYRYVSIILDSGGTRRGFYRPPSQKSSDGCAMSGNGERIPPDWAAMISEVPLGPDPAYTYRHRYGSAVFYWVPLGMLP